MYTPSNIIRYGLGFINGQSQAGEKLSAIFEHAVNVQDISASYKFPLGMNAQSYEHWASSFCSFGNKDTRAEEQFLQSQWHKLVQLNPELEIVYPEGNISMLRGAIFGVASLFNPDDVAFFTDVQRVTGEMAVAWFVNNNEKYKELADFIARRTAVNSRWVRSPETLVKIFEQVKSRSPIYEANKAIMGDPSNPVSEKAIEKANSFINQRITKAFLPS